MKHYTVNDIMREQPCEDNYPRSWVEFLASGKISLNPVEISRLGIPIDDRIWILSRLLYRLSPHKSNRVARMIALDVEQFWSCPVLVWWYLVSGDEHAGDAARAAAWDAARAAAWAAAGERYLGWIVRFGWEVK